MSCTQSDRPEDTLKAREDRLSANDFDPTTGEPLDGPADDWPVLDRDAIFAVEDRPIEAVRVPEWRGVVYVRSFSARERDAWEMFLVAHRGDDDRFNGDNLRATLVALAACDADGQPLFTADDVTALGEKSGAAIDRLYAVARRLNAVSDEDVEDLVKNSESGPNAGPPSNSAGTSESTTPTTSETDSAAAN